MTATAGEVSGAVAAVVCPLTGVSTASSSAAARRTGLRLVALGFGFDFRLNAGVSEAGESVVVDVCAPPELETTTPGATSVEVCDGDSSSLPGDGGSGSWEPRPTDSPGDDGAADDAGWAAVAGSAPAGSCDDGASVSAGSA
ncbi:hypothetical protein ASD37_24875 [Mycobacterium sp. Root135]|uniref:hypothetical protein n=1 Tax=Mycobacterium sp. Root135 TaxID=1736457 RepID=UPI0006F4E295|nr:hypothetical protein [Mycobacterium sp. Root135]KQY04044.1 hypothetical protein ASD37_24875 [Mycobacterium sp. Root135]